ncbi:MAG: phosphoglycerate kinase [Deferribacteraceae bacterium]|nr:phosphoglycerate kinase [Deferribacteraceae bacterium]
MLSVIENLNLKGKNVFLRVDFNVPVKDGVVQDDTRITEALKTIRHILDKGGKLAIGAHFGRPKGREEKYSLKHVVNHINSKGYFKAKLLGDCIGETVANALKAYCPSETLILENLRFYEGEEKNDSAFAKDLAEPFDVYINDAFGVSHRKHASVYGIVPMVAEKGAGFLIEKEAKYFDKITSDPDRPFAAILGGAKVSDKIGVIKSLLDKADYIIVGGAMAYTFLKVLGHKVGSSKVEESMEDTVREIIKKAGSGRLFLPQDHIVSTEFGGKPEKATTAGIPDGYMGLDIGEKSIQAFKDVLSKAKTILWNGPMGVFEQADYAAGTFAIARYLAELSATTVIGGGDSVSAINQAGAASKISHISTGGGASLEYIEFGTLPGIEVLRI